MPLEMSDVAWTVDCVGHISATLYCLGEIEDVITVDSVAVINRG